MSARAPETTDILRDIIQRKKKSRILMKASELDWKVSKHGVRHANVIDFRLGFENSLVNIALSEIPPGTEASDGHKHSLAGEKTG